MKISSYFKSAVNIIIAINVVMFFFHSSYPGGLNNALALHFPQNEKFAAWQFISHMFMHGSLMHLLFNMYALWLFGTHLEKIWGKSRFLIFYFACGLGAAAIYTAINSFQFNEIYSLLTDTGLSSYDINAMIQQKSYPPAVLTAEQASKLMSIYYVPVVGASGAIYGILVAYAFIFPNNTLMLIFLPYPIKAKYFVPALIGLDLFSGVTGISIFGGGIAHFAHVGGAIIGFLLMVYWRKKV
jgi:membrane associated rhomboid family serine protease